MRTTEFKLNQYHRRIAINLHTRNVTSPPPKFARGCAGPAFERPVKSAALRKAEQIGDLAQRHSGFSQIADCQVTAHFVEQLLMRRPERAQLSLQRSRACSQSFGNH